MDRITRLEFEVAQTARYKQERDDAKQRLRDTKVWPPTYVNLTVLRYLFWINYFNHQWPPREPHCAEVADGCQISLAL